MRISLCAAVDEVGLVIPWLAHLVALAPGYRFRHELVRQVLVEAHSSHRPISIHRAAARGLAAAGDLSAAAVVGFGDHRWQWRADPS
jgi:hypothetical protein